TLDPNFSDPRRNQEPVAWTDFSGAEASNGGNGNSLTRNAPGPVAFNAGAASKQIIRSGDGWVEFEASEIDKGHIVGLAASNQPPPPDGDATASDIGFGIKLGNDGNVYTIENGTVKTGPIGSPYVAGERFRVVVTDNNDKT